MDISYYKQFEPFFGAWYITELIGEGSFGKVFEIERTEFGRTYKAALKVITIPEKPSEIKNALMSGMSEQDVTTYYRSIAENVIAEFDMMAKMKGHSNIVNCEDYIVKEHECDIGWDVFIRMELLTPAEYHFAENGCDETNIINLGIDLCKALEVCQKNNIIHRDIKPQNIFISENGDFKLGDFGVAKTIEKTTGELSKKGTYSYMAPEVYKCENYDNSADIYSVGIVLYRYLNNNRTPFLPQPPEMITHSAQEKALEKRMSGEKLPIPVNSSESLAKIILKACEYNPAYRYSSPSEMRRDLESLGMGDAVTNMSEYKTCEGYFKPISTPWPKGKIIIASIVSGIIILFACLGIVLNKFGVFDNKTDNTLSTSDVTSGNVVTFAITEGTTAQIIPASYTFDKSTKTLTVGGTQIGDFDLIDEDWYDLREDVEKVVVLDGTTAVSDLAFNFCINLKSIELPDTLETIGYAAFRHCVSIKEIKIPDSVTSIGANAFEECSSLEKITLGYNLQYLGKDPHNPGSVFKGCVSLASVEIPENVYYIGDFTFKNCIKLQSIYIPENVYTIGRNPFLGCDNLRKITVAPENPYYYSDEYGALFDKLQTQLIAVPVNCDKTNYVFPDSLLDISNWALDGCINVKRVTLPDGFTGRLEYTFDDCPNLESIKVSSSNESYSTDDQGVLYNKDKTWIVTFPQGKTEYSIPESIYSIEDEFSGCKKLKTIRIHKNISSIEADAFNSCDSLEEIVIDSSNLKYTSVDNVLFNKSKSDLIKYPEGKKETSYSVPSGVVKIFNLSNRNLEKIDISDSVVTINYDAFWHCNNLKTISFGKSFTSFGYSGEFVVDFENPFKDCKKLERISVDFRNRSFKTDWYGALYTSDMTKLICLPANSGCTSYTVPDTVNILLNCFYNCKDLKTLTIGSGVSNICIGDEGSESIVGFDGCTSLEHINVSSGNSVFSSVDGVLFDKNQSTLLLYPPAKINEDYTIPSHVIYLHDFAFFNCRHLKRLHIHKNVELNPNAFIGDDSNYKIYYGGSKDKWDEKMYNSDNVFFGYSKLPK